MKGDSEIGSYWPHQFTRLGNPTQVGEQRLDDAQTGHTMVPIMVQPMVCVHCHIEYKQGQENQPPGPCPARSTKRELKRIRS